MRGMAMKQKIIIGVNFGGSILDRIAAIQA
jgi:hypothetical protein